jgi:hypothetical protein
MYSRPANGPVADSFKERIWIMVQENTIDEREFFVIHPLDDVREQKVETEHLGPMKMTPTVRYRCWLCAGTWCS